MPSPKGVATSCCEGHTRALRRRFRRARPAVRPFAPPSSSARASARARSDAVSVMLRPLLLRRTIVTSPFSLLSPLLRLSPDQDDKDEPGAGSRARESPWTALLLSDLSPRRGRFDPDSRTTSALQEAACFSTGADALPSLPISSSLSEHRSNGSSAEVTR